MDLLEASSSILASAGYAVARVANWPNALTFEDQTVLGFILRYEYPNELVCNWAADSDRLVAEHQFGLRRAGEKAWNTYVVLLAREPADYASSIAMSAIEEDLTGTRKLARAGLSELVEVSSALMPLLPLQAAPQLESVDLPWEIRQRSTELPERALRAFLSKADHAVVVQALESPK